ncbi:MAG: ADOP family duplicated permease [bacterium]
MREWIERVRDWRRRDTLDDELAEELQFHRERLERDARVQGASADQVPSVARRKLGNITRMREEARERWSIPWLDHLQQDVRYALRGLRRSPGFTATVVLTLGLGIGANAAMFGVIDRLMFRPFPYLRDPGQVNRVYLQTTSRGKTLTSSVIPHTRYLDLKRFTSSFSQYAALSEWLLAVGSGDASRERQVVGVNASFFAFFDAQPVQGRFFTAGEDSIPRGENVSVISYDFWKSEYGGRNVVGQSLLVGPLLTTIIGVAPKGFVGVSEGQAPAVFLPVTTIAYGVNQGDAQTAFTTYNWDWTSVMVRRKPGVSVATASADLTNAYVQSRDGQRALNPRVVAASIARPRGIAGALKTAAGPDAGLESRTLLWVSGVAVIVLLIACANVTNLVLARVLRRRREIALRLALGAGRGRLVAQFVTEGLLLAALGCVAGLVIAQWVFAALRPLLLKDRPGSGLASDWRTLAAACACALVAGVVTSVAPALLAVREDLAGTLHAGAREGTYQPSRTRSALLTLQGTLSVILLVGAGLFVKSLGNVRSMWLGWNAAPVLLVTPQYRGFQFDSAEKLAFRRRLLETARTLPGVVAVTRVNSLPFSTNTHELHVAGIDSVQRLGRFIYQATTPDYFTVLGTRIIRGRAFSAWDREDAPRVAVVSESMGRILWQGRDPIGQCLQIGAEGVPCTTVVGIAEDAVQNSMTDADRFMYYLSDEQPTFDPVKKRYVGVSLGNRLFLRMSGANPAGSAERVRSELQRIMPGAAYVTVTPLEDIVDAQRRSWQLGATMFVAFGVLALIVAAVGLYGVIGYNVAQRMHEIGVRIALGAQSRDVVKLVVGQGVSFAIAGVALGFAVALLAARWIQPLLFKQSATDPVIYGTVGAILILVALVASAVPALRATRADPNAALRSD